MTAPQISRPALCRTYSRAERLADSVIHVTGLVAALIAVPVLVTLAAVWHGDLSSVGGAAIYGVCLVTMLACSALYNMTDHPRLAEWLRRADHAAIYLKIAGTYTPFVLIGNGQGEQILAGIWVAAAIGMGLKLLAPRRFETAGLLLYLAMGWAAVLLGGPMLDALSTAGLVLVCTGGGLYTVGVGFHLWGRLPFQNAIWHLLVMAASFVFYAAVLVELASRAPVA